MGAFNVVRVHWYNPLTNEVSDIDVQFKYGDTWQYEYEIGDVLKWGGNDIGQKNAKKAVVDGCLDALIAPPGVPEDFEVYIVNGKIENVIAATGQFDFVNSNNAYIILEE